MAAALPYQFEQTSTRVLIVFVGLEMLDELVDTNGQQGHLHFG
jgi:hypothetical protein